MFDLWCPVEGAHVLRWSSHIVTMDHSEPGAIDVLVRCACGQLALLRTGRARDGAGEVRHGLSEEALVPA